MPLYINTVRTYEKINLILGTQLANINVKNQVLNGLFDFSSENLELLRRTTFLKPFIKTMIRDSLLDQIKLENKLDDDLVEKFFKNRNIYDDQNKKNYLTKNLMDEKDLMRISSTQYKRNLFSSKLFEEKTEEFFKKRKEDFDQYIYSLIQVKDQNLAQELYLKLESNESDFSILAKEYSLGPEKYRNGIEGPILLSNINSKIKDILKSTDKGLVCEPFNINDTWLVIRLEEIIYAEFNETMKKILSNELFELFLEKLTREIIEEIREKYFPEKFKYP